MLVGSPQLRAPAPDRLPITCSNDVHRLFMPEPLAIGCNVSRFSWRLPSQEREVNTFVLMLGGAVVLGGCLLGAAALAYMVGSDVRRVVQRLRGQPATVRCPQTGQPMRVRLGRGLDLSRRIFWCERFADDQVRCSTPCLGQVRSRRHAA